MLSIARITGAALAAVMALAACGGASTTTAPQAGSSPAKCTSKKVSIAVPVTPPNVVHIPPFVAQDLGYFKDENLEVDLPKFEGGVGAFRAVASGSVDLAGTSSEPAIQAVAQGGDVKAVYTYAPNVDVSFVAGPNVKTLADLKGKKIGIQEKGGFADVMSRLVLKKAGIAPTDVTFVSTTTAARVSAMVTGSVDTGVLHIDQTLTAQKTAPSLHVLANMWEVVTDYQYSLYMASSDRLKNDAATMECMVRALIKADRAIYDPAMKQKITDIMVKYTKEQPDVVAQTYEQLLKAKAWPQNEGIPKANIEGTIKSLKETDQLNKDVKFTDVVDLTIAKKVVAQLGKKDFPY
jgi:ABC-type nitrate/sulfonate/bicarbonate transport system substrate-binding protein